MRSFATLLALPLLLAANTLIADENDIQTAPRHVVAVEVLIADLAAEMGEGKSDQEIVDRLRELDQQGKLSRVTRMRLTGLSEQTAMAQFGERVPVATGRSPSRGGFRGAGGAAAEVPSVVSYSYENVGTIVELTPHIQDGKVVLHCTVEQSRLAPNKPAADKPEDAFQPSGIETITAKSVVQVKSG